MRGNSDEFLVSFASAVKNNFRVNILRCFKGTTRILSVRVIVQGSAFVSIRTFRTHVLNGDLNPVSGYPPVEPSSSVLKYELVFNVPKVSSLL